MTQQYYKKLLFLEEKDNMGANDIKTTCFYMHGLHTEVNEPWQGMCRDIIIIGKLCVLTCKRMRRLFGKSASFQHKRDTFGVASSKNSLLCYFPFVLYGYHIGQVYSWAGCQHHPRERLTQMLSSSPN